MVDEFGMLCVKEGVKLDKENAVKYYVYEFEFKDDNDLKQVVKLQYPEEMTYKHGSMYVVTLKERE